jgi:hypothetical protein
MQEQQSLEEKKASELLLKILSEFLAQGPNDQINISLGNSA